MLPIEISYFCSSNKKYRPAIKRLSNILRFCITGVACLYAAFIVLLNIPYVQQRLSLLVSKELSKLLQTEVCIGNINMGLLNRVILDNVSIQDQKGIPLLEASRISAKVDIEALLQHKIVVNNIQLYRLHLNLAQRDSLSAANYQFLIDALSSKDTVPTKNNLNLRINAILIRHGHIAYNQEFAEETPGRFNPKHIQLDELRANISLKALRNDSLNTTIRHLSFTEQSGFELRNLAFKLVANPHSFILSRFALELPGSEIKIDTLRANYDAQAKESWKTIRVDGDISKSHFTLSDLKCFEPSLSSFTAPLWIRAHLRGNAQEISLYDFQLQSDNNDIQLHLYCRIRNPFEPHRSFIDCNLSRLNISNTGLRFLSQNLKAEMPPFVMRLGYFSFQGSARGMFKDLQLRGNMESASGAIQTNLHLDLNNKQKTFHGSLLTENFQLGQLTQTPDLGRVSLNVEVKGHQLSNSRYPHIAVAGNIPLLEYKRHTYSDIRINAQYQGGYYKGYLTVNDPDGQVAVNGEFNPTKAIPEFNLTASVDHFRPDTLHLSKNYPDTEFSARLKTNFRGNTFDNMVGSIRIDSLYMLSPEDSCFLEHFTVSSFPEGEKQRNININSDFMHGEVHGEFQFASLPANMMHLLHQYLPSLISAKKPEKTSNNQLNFELSINNTDFLSKMFHLPLNLHLPGNIKGNFHERNNHIKVEGYFPSFSYNGTRYESGMVLINNSQDKLQASARISKQIGRSNSSMINLTLKTEAQNDQLRTRLNWGNNTVTTYSGEIATVADFFKHDETQKAPSMRVSIQPSNIIINDTVWTLRQSDIAIDSSRITIDNFSFEHGKQHLHINGNLTQSPDDSLCIDLRNIRLEYIFDIIQFKPVDFRGIANGKAFVKHALNKPSLNADLNISRFTFNGGLMGDMNVKGRWDADEGNIYLDADIRETSPRSRTTVQGWVSPPKAGLDLHITADSTNVEFLNMYTANVFDSLTGKVTGDIRLHGPFANLNLEGTASGNATAQVGILHTEYKLRLDSVSLLPNTIEFRKASMQDKDGNKGTIRGMLHHNHLRDISYNFSFDTDNMLLYDVPDDNETLVYGSIYGTGITTLQGGADGLNVNTNIRTGRNTSFIYKLGTPEEIADNGFITFVDKTPRPKWENEKIPDPFKELSDADTVAIDTAPIDIRLNAQLDITPDATIRVIMDPISGDYAMAQGSGNFQANFYNKGDFKLYGTYTLDHGVYKLSLQEVIRKDFQLQPGGSITFSGLPRNGDIDLQAVYTVNSASLKDLAPNGTFSQNSVRVNCLLNLTGKLAAPNIHFDLELPTVNDEERELVRSYISTDEQMEMQIIYLLGIGRFYTYDYANTNMDNSNGQSSAMNSLLSSTLSGQLNNMLSHIINSNQWNFGTNLSTGDNGWTDMEVEGMLSGRLLNNRLLINGNFGYRDNQLANTNFIGDFDVQWLLTPSGDLRLKGYNQTNDRYFAKTTLTTQGIGLLFKRDFDHLKELFHRNWKTQRDTLRADTATVQRQKVKKQKRKKKKKWSWDF
mgnify:CR=1 FL=1